MEWENAEVGEQQQKQVGGNEIEMTTDDLVMMIGEGTIKERHNAKQILRLRQGVESLQQVLAKERSISIPLRDQLAACQSQQEQALQSEAVRMQEKEEQASAAIASLQGRIAELEGQVYATALERDAAMKEAVRMQEKEEQASRSSRAKTSKPGQGTA